VQLQPQLPVVPLAVPPFWHTAPFAPVVHALAVSQLAPLYPAVQLQPQLPVVPLAVPPFWHTAPFAPVVHVFAV
jgi:hypothetical protein